jgi:hypothetical protein
VHLSVAGEKALATESSQVLKEESSLAFRLHHGEIEVDQVGVVCRTSLSDADAMGIVTNGTRRSLFHDVQPMLREACIRKDAVPAVAFVAEGIVEGALRGIVKKSVVHFQYVREDRSMGSPWVGGNVGIVAVTTKNHAIGPERW